MKTETASPFWYKVASHLRVLGTPAPVFPGYEVDISAPVQDAGKQDAVWHRERSKAILQAHPEVKQLFGRHVGTAAWCISFAVAQLLLAALLWNQPLWLIVLASYVVGSWINICLFNLAHDCNHGLVFKKNLSNVWLFTFTSLPMFLPGHHTWWIEHHMHHNDLGSPKDFVKRRRNFLALTRSRVLFVIQDGPIYKMLTALSTPLLHPYSLLMVVTQALRTGLGLLMYLGQLLTFRVTPNRFTLSVLGDEHLVAAYQRYRLEWWAVVYSTLSLAMMGILFWLGGWKPLLYLLLSQIFMTGFLHPLNFGLILSNSHFNEHATYQPTSSYYGWLNKITFNFGLHTEHHDISG
ncbi:MAG: fatty acid desaturase, partial [Planctomycetota bacterium]